MSGKKIEVQYFHDVHEQILDLHEAMQEIGNSGLTEEAIVTLLQSTTKESKTTIRVVLHALQNMDRFLK